MFRQTARVAALAARAGSIRAPVRTLAARAFQQSKRTPVLTASAVAAAGVVAAFTVDQASCDFDWRAWVPSFLGGKPAESDKYASVRADIKKIVEDNSAGPILVRLAWHASGTYDIHTKTGGSNGATMRFPPECKHGANAGLQEARDLLEPLKQKYPDMSYADLWTLAGAVAIEACGGPKVNWRPGRTDAADGTACPPDGRLPNAAKNEDHIRDIFYRMGLNDREIVALIGAHTLGMCHPDRSGYNGPWTRDPNAFDNSFFQLLLDEKWTLAKTNPPQFEDSTGALMMLPADLALVLDPEFKKYVELYAKDQNAWFADFAKAFSKLMELGVKF